MKTAALAIIATLTFAPALAAASAEQGQSHEKTKTTQSKGQAKGQAKGKGKKAGPAGTTGTSSLEGCSPDTIAPVVHSVTATPTVLEVPNHRMIPVTITAKVTDNCAGAVTWSVTSVASDEPINGLGDGDTAPDWNVTSGHALQLRAERAGNGDGRVYTVTITARDAADNTATATTTVTVPHDRR